MGIVLTIAPRKGEVVNENQIFTVDGVWTNTLGGAPNLVDIVATAVITNNPMPTPTTTAEFVGSAETSGEPLLIKRIMHHSPVVGEPVGGTWNFQFDVQVSDGWSTTDFVEIAVTVSGWVGWQFKPLWPGASLAFMHDASFNPFETVTESVEVHQE